MKRSTFGPLKTPRRKKGNVLHVNFGAYSRKVLSTSHRKPKKRGLSFRFPQLKTIGTYLDLRTPWVVRIFLAAMIVVLSILVL